MCELPPLPQPYPYLRVGHLGAPPVPEGIGTAIDLAEAEIDQALGAGLDCVVVSAEGSAERIAPRTLELLTACEAAGVPTVLRAGAEADLRSPVAAVVSHLALETEALYQEGLRMVGPERAFAIQPSIDPLKMLTEADSAAKDRDAQHHTAESHTAESHTVQAAERRRRLLAKQSPRAQAERFMKFLGLPVEPEPLVTALIVSRHAKNLHYSLQNLKRQAYGRIDPLLVIDPLYERQARELTADWDIPVRIVTANPRSTPADKLNVGVQHAYGEIVAVIEETGLYGSHYLVDQVQALQSSQADLVGKASWFVWNDQLGKPTVHASAKQRSFDHVPALGTLVLHRATAQTLGFTRRVSSVEGVLARRIRDAGGRVYVSDAFDALLLRRGQALEDFADAVLDTEAFSKR